MRLYRPRTLEEQLRPMGMISKKDVRKWLEENEKSWDVRAGEGS